MKNKKILVFSPHAVDVEIAMGGTIAKLSRDNEIVLVTCILPTENRAGDKDQQMIDHRGIEQAKSARILGAKLHLMNLDVYKFAYNREYVKLFDQLILLMNQMWCLVVGNTTHTKTIKHLQRYYILPCVKMTFHIICTNQQTYQEASVVTNLLHRYS